jgi:hypothetical protein
MAPLFPPAVNRRALLGLLGVAATTRLPALPLAAPQPLVLDLDRPLDNLTAWMKMRASLESQDVYFWFTGGLDLALPGEAIRPIITVETLILRRTQRVAAATFQVTDWEASFYRDMDSGSVATVIVNPVTGARVEPLHYREGPVTFEYTPERQPRLLGMQTPFAEKAEPFRQPWRVLGDDLWMTKAFYISGRPQWLDRAQFPEETPATPLTVSSIATMRASLTHVLDPARSSVPTDYAYQATSDWLPWMKMGQRPGFVVWHEAGKKLFNLEEVPPDSLAALERIHPVWFKRPVPWEGFTNLFLLYREQRGPRG